MSELKIDKLAEHSIRVIIIPQEKILTPVSDVLSITHGNVNFVVLDFISISKGDKIPISLKLLSIGKNISDDKIWNIYKESSKMHFFIVEKL